MASQRNPAGPVLAIVGGAVLLISLFIAWFSELACGQDSCSALKTFSVVDIALLVVVVLAVAAGIAGLLGAFRVPGVLVAAAGMLATGMVFAFLVEFGDDLSTRFGIYLGLLASLAIAAGGTLMAMAPAAAAPAPGPAAAGPPGAPAGLQGASPAAAAQPGTPAGWYPDPSGGGGQRYWDGTSWTEHKA
ncbi:MAG: DUF2510 domain-containing protein [Thermoleophilaceae bacterium]